MTTLVAVDSGSTALPFVTNAPVTSNWAALVSAAPNNQTQSAANSVCVAALALPVLYTGLFYVDLRMGYASGTTAKTVRHFLGGTLITAPAAPGFSGGSSSNTIYGSSVGPDATATQRSKIGQTLNVDAAGVTASGLAYNGSTGFVTIAGTSYADSGAQPTLTGLLSAASMTFSAGGLIGIVSAAPRVNFTVSTPAVPQYAVFAVILKSTAGGDVIGYQYLSLTAYEWPFT